MPSVRLIIQSARKYNSRFCYTLLIMIVEEIVPDLEDLKIFYVRKYTQVV
jgi:hypothetical protein